MSIWRMKFERVQVDEMFSDLEDGDVWVKTSPTEAECERSIGGGYAEGDVRTFGADVEVELKN